MANLKNVIGLAKGEKRKPGRPPKNKSNEETNNISNIIHDSSLDKEEKAKETVEQLLADSPINEVLENDKLLELDADVNSTISEESYKWLEDQVVALSAKNEELRTKVKELGGNPNAEATSTEKSVINLFLEIQGNYLKHLPTEKKTGVPTKVNLNYLLKYFIDNFPFVLKYRKF